MHQRTKLACVLALVITTPQSAKSAESAQLPLNAADVDQFLARPSVIALPEQRLNVEDPTMVLLKGTRDSEGNCTWFFTIDHLDFGTRKDRVFSTVEIAYDPTTCEVIEKRGYRTAPSDPVDAMPKSGKSLKMTLPVEGGAGAAGAVAGPTGE